MEKFEAWWLWLCSYCLLFILVCVVTIVILMYVKCDEKVMKFFAGILVFATLGIMVMTAEVHMLILADYMLFPFAINYFLKYFWPEDDKRSSNQSCKN